MRALTTVQRTLLPVHSSHALKHRPDSPQTASSQWQRFCLFQRDCLLTQKGLFEWSNNPSMIKLLFFGQIKDYKDRNVWISMHLRVHKKQRGRYTAIWKCQYKQIWCGLVLHIVVTWWNDFNQFKDECHCLLSKLFYDPHFFLFLWKYHTWI